jgi:hypothetical protein
MRPGRSPPPSNTAKPSGSKTLSIFQPLCRCMKAVT